MLFFGCLFGKQNKNQDLARNIRFSHAKKTNVSSEVLILSNNLEKSRPRSKHSSFSCSRAPSRPYLVLILAPWPHLGPILASLGPSWPIPLGLILAPFWLHLGVSWPLFADALQPCSPAALQPCSPAALQPYSLASFWAPARPSGAPSRDLAFGLLFLR